MLLDTIDSILAGRTLPREIVVVDQSRAANAEVAGHLGRAGCEICYIHSNSAGVSRARNLGIRAANNDVVILIDDDMFVEPDTIDRLLQALGRDDSRRIVTGRTLAAPADGDGGGRTQAAAALITRSEPAVFRGRQPIQVVPGTNIALHRRVFLEIGGYDERMGPGTRFPAGEDRDLALRLMDAGCEVRHVPEAVVLHRSWRTMRDLLAVRWGYARGIGAFYAKHASVRDHHVLGLAAREIRTRISVAARTLLSSPSTAAGHVVSLTGLLTGAAGWAMRHGAGQRSDAGRIIVLAYHSVADLSADPVMAPYGVPADRMAAQLDAVRRQGWKFIDLDALLGTLRSAEPLPRRAALVTFDDGYADLLTAGVPVLDERRIPAVVFVASAYVGGSNGWVQEPGNGSLRLLDADELRALAAHRIEVGSHSRGHRDLVHAPAEDLEREVQGAGHDLVALGLPRPRAFAYPYGSWSAAVADAVARAGYEVGFTADRGVVRKGLDRCALPRLELTAADTGLQLRLKLATAGWPRRLRRMVWRWAGIRK
jgi:peptidoglycan/xylan/chitin deacetylase (PgdA/CDA1 family)/GT2 family glycosyltransferase